jgi:hypothetical protein
LSGVIVELNAVFNSGLKKFATVLNCTTELVGGVEMRESLLILQQVGNLVAEIHPIRCGKETDVGS